jgi:uncharacterized alkaline shock family protein YloU
MALMTNPLGVIDISDDVVATIVGYSVGECYGVVGMAAKRAADGLAELLNWENIRRGVRVNHKGGAVTIDIYIIVEYGLSISAVAESAIQTIKYNVETYTGLTVNAVNVVVEGIRVQDEEA